MPSQPSMAPASPLSAGHRLSAAEVSVPPPSRPPPCLRLPTPTGDPPPRSPLSKKPSPSMLSSVSMLCSSLTAAPQVASEPTPPRTSSPRYELAAIAFLSTVPLRHKVGSGPRIPQSKLPHAIHRPCSPLPCKASARASCVSGPGAMSTPRNVLPSSPPSTQRPYHNEQRSNRFAMTHWGPQVASPVPRKCGSSFPSLRLDAPNPTIPHACAQEEDSLQSKTHRSPYRGSPTSQQKLPAYAFKADDAPLTSIWKGDTRVSGHTVRRVGERSSCTGHDLDTRTRLSAFSSDTEECRSRVYAATPGVCAKYSVTRPLREEENLGILQQTSAGEAQDGLEKWALGEKTCCPCDWILRQRSPSQLSSASWHEKTSEDLRLPLRLANVNGRDNAQRATVSCCPAKTGLYPLPFDCSDPCLQQLQRTRCTNCAECPVNVECGRPESADGNSFLSPLSERKRLLPHHAGHPATQHMRHARREQFLEDKGTEREAEQNVTQFYHGICRRPKDSAFQNVSNPCSALGQNDRFFLPPLETHSSRGGRAVVAPLSHTEAVRRSGALSPFARGKTDSDEAKLQPFTGRPPSTPRPRHGSADPFPNNVVACRLVSAVAQTSPAGGLAHATCRESDTEPAVSFTNHQVLSSTTFAAAGAATDQERNIVAAVGAQDAGASAVTRAGVDAFLASFSNLNVVGEGHQSIRTSVSCGAQQDGIGAQQRQNGLHESSGIVKNEEEGHFVTPGGALIREPSTELPQWLGEKRCGGGDRAEKALVTDVIPVNSEEAYLFSELQQTLRELQAHRTALRASDIIFDTKELPSLERSVYQATEKSENIYKGEETLSSSQVPCVRQTVHYCVLEEGSFGKVFVGRFLGKLPTGGGRRWWRTLPLCERSLEAVGCALPYPATGFLPPHAQNAIENNVKVAIKVPVEAMMVRDPVGVLARTLNEWKILALVQEKRKMMFSVECGSDGGVEYFDGVAVTVTTRSGNATCRMKAGHHTSYGASRDFAPSTLCQEQVSAEGASSPAFENWHPMHPQAEPPGVVELVGGVVHGPLDVWLVTRLAAGKDLHTRKYSRSLADGMSIPPAAGLAMCRQLAAIVDFLHARTKQTLRRQCAPVATVHNRRTGRFQRPSEELSKHGRYQNSGRLENIPSDGKAVPYNCRELHPGGNFSCSVNEAPVIVHRDIKPENIIVDDNWRIQLCDFGDAEASPDGIVSRVSGATWLYAPVELLCAAPLKSSTVEQGVEFGDLSQREYGCRMGAPMPCTHMNGARSGDRALSCLALPDMENQWVQNGVCSSADCASTRVTSSYRSVDAVFTEKWDIWSMGCVFQEMFGLPNPMSPYVSPTDPPHVVYEKLKRRARSGQLVPVVAPEIQGIARQIIFACLRSDPQARPSAAAVLRMWGAPEEEILKDIRLSSPLPTQVHSAPHVGISSVAAAESAKPNEFCARPPAIDTQRAFMVTREQHAHARNTGRKLYKLVPTPCSPERKLHHGERFDGGIATQRRLNSQDEVYIVPNLAIVPRRCNPGVTCTGLAA